MYYITTVIYFAKLVKELRGATQMHKQEGAVGKTQEKFFFLKKNTTVFKTILVILMATPSLAEAVSLFGVKIHFSYSLYDIFRKYRNWDERKSIFNHKIYSGPKCCSPGFNYTFQIFIIQ